MGKSLLLGFVNKKMSLAYETHKASKMSTRRGEEGWRAQASTSRRGGARPAQVSQFDAEAALAAIWRGKLAATSSNRDTTPHW